MPKPRKRPEKAYNDSEFLNSTDARPIRILAELFEPLRRFRQHDVRDTVVFFGSTRIHPMAEARRLHKAAQQTTKTRRSSAALRRRQEAAERGLIMARYYEDATELARLITAWSKTLGEGNRFIVCSGGGPGIMEAANRGATLAGGPSVGLNISLPLEQFPNAYITEELNFEFHYFFMRKFWFAYLAKALIIFPGGFGTIDELFEVMTLVQTRKILKPLPIVIYGPDYWREILDFDALVRWGTISEEDLKIFRFFDTPQEAFDYLREELEQLYLRGERAPKSAPRTPQISLKPVNPAKPKDP
ncbi:MAG: TIGR00730 family Rossman fold protein [Candidatus Latescibacteria bacterium]|nr:TIGR00730 family Rossman fold protein [Candidatus Latescibacterota bacterium]